MSTLMQQLSTNYEIKFIWLTLDTGQVFLDTLMIHEEMSRVQEIQIKKGSYWTSPEGLGGANLIQQHNLKSTRLFPSKSDILVWNVLHHADILIQNIFIKLCDMKRAFLDASLAIGHSCFLKAMTKSFHSMKFILQFFVFSKNSSSQ